MHELSLAKAIIENITKLADENKAKQVKSITLSIGSLSGVVKECMEFCLPEASKGTILEGTQVKYLEVPLTVYCKQCDKKTEPDQFFVHCKKCNNTDVEVIAGKDFNIVNMEIE